MLPNTTPPNPPVPDLSSVNYAIGETEQGLAVLRVSGGATQLDILFTPDTAQKVGKVLADTGQRLGLTIHPAGIIVPPTGTFKMSTS